MSEFGSWRLPDFVLVTGNANKVIEAERLVGQPLRHCDVDLPEIQSNDLIEVLRAKAEVAWQRLECPLVVEETGLELAALNGFPGPLVKWMLEAIGSAGMGRLVHTLGEPRAVACCALLYVDAEHRVLGRGRTPGRLVAEPRGDAGFGWDPVFVPELETAGGNEKTYAELGEAEKDRSGHRGLAWSHFVRQMAAEGLASPNS